MWNFDGIGCNLVRIVVMGEISTPNATYVPSEYSHKQTILLVQEAVQGCNGYQ